jgi:hypothetical protein
MKTMQLGLVVLVGVVLAWPGLAIAQATTKAPAKKGSTMKAAPAASASAKGDPAKPAEAAPAKPAEPATPEQAAKVIDLRTFPLMEGGQIGGIFTLGILMYEAPGTAKAAFEFQRRELVKRGFQEQPGGYFTDDSGFALFTKDGFRVSVSTGSGREKGNASVTLVNDGNVDLAKLPVPPGVKPFHPRPTEASYTTTAKVADTAAACRKLLIAAGWQPIKQSSGGRNQPDSTMEHFKWNGIDLQLWVMTTPAEGGKTLIRYSTELLQVDFPVPPEVASYDYHDSAKFLRFAVPTERSDELIAFYQDRLTKKGWEAATDKPIVDEQKGQKFLVFRNAAKDLISLTLYRHDEEVQVKLSHQTAEQLAEEERLAKIEAEKERLAAAKRNEKFKVVVPVPANGENLDQLSERTIEFELAAGSGQPAIKALRDHYVKEGWKEKDAEFGKVHGEINLTKDKLELELSYRDTGYSAADIQVFGSSQVVLETVASKDKVASDKPASEKPGTEKPGTAKPKAKKPAIPGLPELPPGVELPDDVKAELEKALEGLKKP